jgi:hypothetical protein
MRPRSIIATGLLWAVCLATPASAGAQTPGPRPWGRVSFYSDFWQTAVPGLPSRGFGEFATSVTYQMPDQDDDGLEAGVDVRHAAYTSSVQPQRVSVYEAFVGARVADGRLRARVGHMWLNDLGSLGSVAGALFEYRGPADSKGGLGRLRVGAFGGLEPMILEAGYAPGVTKYGGYVAFDGEHARRDVIGFVTLRDHSLTERSVLTTMNFVPIGRKFFVYQAAEFDLQAPAGQGRAGLSYFFANLRASPASRLELQANTNRGRSVDTRGLTLDVLSGRPLTQTAIDGLLYESAGGRVTVEVVPRVRVYAGYSRDKTNRDTAPTGRTTIGGYAGNLLRSGFDLAASESLFNGPARQYHSQYISLGRQLGRHVYLSGDYSTSLSIIQFSRSDGILIEIRPASSRISGSGTIYIGRFISLLTTVDRTIEDSSRELRILTGITYRFR